MKKARRGAGDELRSEYKRSDFDALVRGKYVERLREKSNVVVLDPRVAEFFPNAASVNSALLSLQGTERESLPLSLNPAFVKIIRRARAEVKRGEVYSLKQIKQEMLAVTDGPNKPLHRSARKAARR